MIKNVNFDENYPGNENTKNRRGKIQEVENDKLNLMEIRRKWNKKQMRCDQD